MINTINIVIDYLINKKYPKNDRKKVNERHQIISIINFNDDNLSNIMKKSDFKIKYSNMKEYVPKALSILQEAKEFIEKNKLEKQIHVFDKKNIENIEKLLNSIK